MVQTPNKQLVLLKQLPEGYPVVGEHIDVRESTIDLEAPLQEGQALIKVHVISIDPFLRSSMRGNSRDEHIPPVDVDQPMYGYTLSTVIKSNIDKFQQDDIVVGITNLEEYTTISSSDPFFSVTRVRNDIKNSVLPLSYYVGVLGMPGHTAYAGLFEVGKPKKGETLFVSAAAGAVGQIVGQLGKILGLRVLGSAGSDEKIAYLKEIGFDAVFNYKTTSNISEKLTELAPKGIDVYFDNVGGETLEAVLENANRFARIVACGMISTYYSEKDIGVRNLMKIVPKHITLEGFAVFDYMHLEDQFTNEVTQWLKEEKMKYRESTTNGIDGAAQALVDAMHGKNNGKQIVHVSSPSF
ncbi:hypothetical protein BDA99DRAFT_493132 [Phascolomyces articulosus]|uniref:Enoyl reductase (ER) domain-containing protein n=1 Tax=Phascolomyces articulosus TaxID=60185 RepID=A0AAD5PJI0_9FUNG|nr:hypothetical protein BDA99DRAFT_493132 [Phascolomyces articulosus]